MPVTPKYDLDTDNTLGGSNASNYVSPSQKAVKDYVDAHSGGANTDLSNLTSQGQNIANWSNNVTNCITEIPQDIKLELSGTTLTSKAGSKVYIPNGMTGDTLNFTEVTLSSDLTFSTWGSASTDLMMFYNNGALAGYSGSMYSGATQPTTAGLWYDTTNNYMKYSSNGTTWTVSNIGLPLGLVGRNSGSPTAIHQVFNGFGYIGSTVFALPGVKGLIPNGRNADGSLKNTPYVINSVIIRTWTNQSAEGMFVVDALTSGGYHLSIRPSAYYDEDSNVLVNVGVANEADIGYAKLVSGVISNIIPKTAFHALDYNDSSTISGWAMPSGRYIDLTLGASNTDYQAPANGYAFLQKASTASGQGVSLYNRNEENTANISHTLSLATASGQYPAVLLPVKKGNYFRAGYTAAGTSTFFRFIYSEGEN